MLFSLHVPKDVPSICHLQPLFAEPINLTTFGTCNLLPLILRQSYLHGGIEEVVNRPEFWPFKFRFEFVPIKRVCMHPSHASGPPGRFENGGVDVKTLGFQCFIGKYFRH